MTTAPHQSIDSLSEQQAEALYKAQETVHNGRSLTLLQAMAVKRALKEALPPKNAIRHCEQTFAPGPALHRRGQAAVSQLTAAETGALVMHVLHSGRETIEMYPARAFG
jgi:hypothetical protein